MRSIYRTTNLFGIPAGDDNGTKRRPAIPEQVSQATDDLMNRRSTRGRVGGAHDPCCIQCSSSYFKDSWLNKLTIPVVANHDYLVLDMSRNDTHGVPDGNDPSIDYKT